MTGSAVHTLITHSGSFHTDDLLAFVLLRAFFPEAPLVRTRDAALIEAADSGSIVLDVGMAYTPATLRYDHHQLTRTRHPEGRAYSARGKAGELYSPAPSPRYWNKASVAKPVLR